jgi:hypothetical protein
LIQDNRVIRVKKGKNFGGMRKPKTEITGSNNCMKGASSLNSPLKPLPMQVTKNNLPSPHNSQDFSAPFAPAPDQMSARRNKFETARLKDQNITLNSEITRRQAEVAAFQRFQARSSSIASSLEEKLSGKDIQIQQLERQNAELKRTVEGERSHMITQLAATKRLSQQHDEAEEQMDFKLRCAKKQHQDELVRLRRQLHLAQEELSQQKQQNKQQQNHHQQQQTQGQVATDGEHQAPQVPVPKTIQVKGSASDEDLKQEVQKLTVQVSGMKRELSIKDRQLQILREEIEEQDTANRANASSDNYAEVLEEELSMMKASFEKKLKEAEEKYQQLTTERMKEQNQWEREKREMKAIETGLKIEVDRKTKQLRER